MGCHHAKSAESQENALADPRRARLSMSQSDKVPQKAAEKGVQGTVKALDEGTILDLFPDHQTSQKRIVVLGSVSEIQQKGFADKKVVKSLHTDDASKAPDFKDYKIGYACKKGLKPESPNQDDFCILVTDAVSIFGVFDGHGPFGHEVSHFVHESLPETVVKDSRFKSNTVEALKDAFPRTHRLCTEAAEQGYFDCALSGTTATLVVLQQGSLYVANVGDSRAVLAKGSRGGELRSEDLTPDHKPDCEAESKRILATGRGQVRRLEGDIPKRVFLKDKMYPGLAMTRSIGDTVGVDAGVISTPDVTERRIEQDWRFLLVCSDGVWEFISSQEAVELVSRYSPTDCQKGAEALASEAWNRWIQEEQNVVDDITVILYWFPDK